MSCKKTWATLVTHITGVQLCCASTAAVASRGSASAGSAQEARPCIVCVLLAGRQRRVEALDDQRRLACTAAVLLRIVLTLLQQKLSLYASKGTQPHGFAVHSR